VKTSRRVGKPAGDFDLQLESGFESGTKDIYDRVDDGVQRFVFENSNLGYDQIVTCREQLAGACVTRLA
jgi:hypothetical protein